CLCAWRRRLHRCRCTHEGFVCRLRLRPLEEYGETQDRYPQQLNLKRRHSVSGMLSRAPSEFNNQQVAFGFSDWICFRFVRFSTRQVLLLENRLCFSNQALENRLKMRRNSQIS